MFEGFLRVSPGNRMGFSKLGVPYWGLYDKGVLLFGVS